MKIGIIGAMEQEVMVLRDRLSHSILYQQAGCKIYAGRLHGVEVELVKSGIGKVLAALGTTLLLDHFKPDLVINIGVASGLALSLEVGDIVVSHEVCYHDVDVTIFGYKPGQMAQCPVSFNASPLLVALALEIVDRIGMNAIRGLVVSGDVFINSAEDIARIRQTFPQAIAVEMEATAIAHVCHQFAVPFIVIRAISDVANQVSHLSFKKILNMAAQKVSSVVEEMVNVLDRQRVNVSRMREE